MKVAVNTRLLLKNKLDGIGWFTFEVMKRIVLAHPEVDFLFLFDRPFSSEFIFADNVQGKVVFPQARLPFLYHWWFEYSLPKVMAREKVDVFFSPEGFISLKSKLPAINVLHDINFEHQPEGIKPFHRKYFRKYFPKYAHKAKKIITVSHFSKQDIIKTYHLDANKIEVIYNGVGEQYTKSNTSQVKETRDRFTKGHPFFLFVGSMQPRKNIAGLLQAFDVYKGQETSEQKVQLLLVGNKHFWTPDMERAYSGMQYKDAVIFTGRVHGDDLVKVYGAAKALVYVPLFEGFGLPVVEAFKSEVPVVTSNTSSLPEVAGEAALLVDPHDYHDIAKALIKVASDDTLCEQLVQKGLKQAEKFTWDRSAHAIWDEIKKAVDDTIKI